MELNSSFPERLREAIGEMKLTDFARTVGISKQSVSAYLNGTRKPKQPVIQVIASSLNVSPAWLSGYNVPKFIATSDTGSSLLLTATEKQLISDYRDASPDIQSAAALMLSNSAQKNQTFRIAARDGQKDVKLTRAQQSEMAKIAESATNSPEDDSEI